jgi:hypothetical protein
MHTGRLADILLGVTSLAVTSMLLGSPVLAQTPAEEPAGNAVTIETANKFQQVVPATGTERRALSIENSNSDNCWVFIGGGKASKEKSITLDPGTSYGR